MSSTGLEIKHESLPERCEICHLADCFDAQTNTCTRCQGLRTLAYKEKVKALQIENELKKAEALRLERAAEELRCKQRQEHEKEKEFQKQRVDHEANLKNNFLDFLGTRLKITVAQYVAFEHEDKLEALADFELFLRHDRAERNRFSSHACIASLAILLPSSFLSWLLSGDWHLICLVIASVSFLALVANGQNLQTAQEKNHEDIRVYEIFLAHENGRELMLSVLDSLGGNNKTAVGLEKYGRDI